LPLRLLLLLNACEKERENIATAHGVKYEVFVLSFADGDGDGKVTSRD
jgi:hypothetical protein